MELKTAIAGGIAFLSFSSDLSALLIDRLEYRHFASEAELIVRGTVTEESYRAFSEQNGPEGQQLPFTFTTVQIHEVLKGEPENPESVVLRTEAGVLPDGETFRITSGVPLFDVGDQGIFFINRNPENGRPTNDPLVGLDQGFTRFLPDGSAMNELKYELLHTDDPVFAARVHPRDVRDYALFMERLRSPANAGQQRVAGELSEASKLLLEDPEAQDNLPRAAFTFAMPEDRADEVRASIPETERSLPDLLEILMPHNYRNQARTIRQAFLYRDLNHLLFRRDLFTPEMLADIGLRPVTKELLNQDPQEMPIDLVLKRNRRAMEDIFPRLLLKTMKTNVVRGPYRAVEAMMVTQMGEHELRMAMPPTDDGEGGETGANERPEGVLLDQGAFSERLGALIDHIHTEDELANLPVTLSHDADAPFTPRDSIALPPPQDFRLPGEVPAPLEAGEAGALEANDGNPVLPNRR
jgi:hypothetical protein